jgi:hypothetical protein
MLSPAHLALFALVAVGVPLGAQESKLEPEQPRLLEKAREAALRYEASLPDFICTQVVNRWQRTWGASWTSRLLDSLTVKLTYFEHKEDYELMRIDGWPTSLKYLQVSGALSTGEFGTRLFAIFHPGSQGEFRWKGWSTLRERRVARFSFRVAREHSTFRVQLGHLAAPTSPNSTVVPYHGDVFVDKDTHMALRLKEVAEIPRGFPIHSSESTVDYDFVDVGGRRFLLPARASTKTRRGDVASENQTEFRDYRKFQTESQIRYGSPVDKK